MKFRIITVAYIIVSSFINSADAQNGCTDINATNYNASATTNDGSCLYPTTYRTPLLKFSLITLLSESSGLVFTDGKLWSHDDSGNSAEIYSIDTSDGHLLQRVLVDNFPNIDWEEITADSLYIYIGDFGNNSGIRTDLKILKIKKADLTNASTVHVLAEAINFSYTDQTSFVSSNSHNFDCEAMIALNDSLYIFTKDRGDYKTRVYKLPKLPGTYAVGPYTSYTVNGLITGATYNKSKNEIVLIGYQNNHAGSFLWYLNEFSNIQFFSGNKRRIEIGNNSDWQTEGICWIDSSRLYISNETSSAQVASLCQTDKYFNLNTNLPLVEKKSEFFFPNPAQHTLYFQFPNASNRLIEIINYKGDLVFSLYTSDPCFRIDVSSFSPALYFVKTTEQSTLNSDYSSLFIN